VWLLRVINLDNSLVKTVISMGVVNVKFVLNHAMSKARTDFGYVLLLPVVRRVYFCKVKF